MFQFIYKRIGCTIGYDVYHSSDSLDLAEVVGFEIHNYIDEDNDLFIYNERRRVIEPINVTEVELYKH